MCQFNFYSLYFSSICADKDYPMIMSLYLALLARTLLINQMVFGEVLEMVTVQNAFEQILDVWLNRMPCVVNKDKKKLLALGLASLLTVQNGHVHERIPTIMMRLSETLNDIMREDDETGQLSE